MLLPLIEFLLVLLAYRSVLNSTVLTVKYFSVATAVEQAVRVRVMVRVGVMVRIRVRVKY